MGKHKDELQEAYNKLAVDDLGLKAEVENLKVLVTLLYAAVKHPKKESSK
jgi:hypothetical protein